MAQVRQSMPESGRGLQVKVRIPNMAQVRQSRPYSGLGLQVQVLTTFRVAPSSLGSEYLTLWYIRLLGKLNLNSHCARPVPQIISTIKWIRTCRLSKKKELSLFHLRDGPASGEEARPRLTSSEIAATCAPTAVAAAGSDSIANTTSHAATSSAGDSLTRGRVPGSMDPAAATAVGAQVARERERYGARERERDGKRESERRRERVYREKAREREAGAEKRERRVLGCRPHHCTRVPRS